MFITFRIQSLSVETQNSMEKKYLNEYILRIDEEVKSNIQKEYNLSQPFFQDFKTFDYTNFYLIQHYILGGNDKDFFLGVPENIFRPNFYSSIFHSLILIKLFQNYFNFENRYPKLEVGDLIYCKYQDRFRVCTVETISDNIYVKLKFPARNEVGINRFKLKNEKYTKLNPQFVENKRTAPNIDNYRKFLQNIFFEDFPFITDFKNKSLVIAEKSFYNESKLLPIRYISKNGTIANNLPFNSYLIECCNDFKSAKNFLLDKGEKYDEIILIGDNKYRDSLSHIIQETKWTQKVKNIILIGNDIPSSQDSFIKWLWAKDEIKIANNDKINYPRKRVIENERLYLKICHLNRVIGDIKQTRNVDLSFLLKYTNFFFRIILADSNLSKGIYQEYKDRLQSFFNSDKFEEELLNCFYNQDIYNPTEIKNYTQKIFQIFQDISGIIEYDNKKWKYIKDKSEKFDIKNLHLIIEKKSFDAVSKQIKDNKINNIKVISDKMINPNDYYLDKWISDNDLNRNNITYIIPYLSNMDLLDKIKLIKGTCEVLCYKDIDEIAYDNIINRSQNDDKKRLTHSDRNKFLKNLYKFNSPVIKRQLDNLFQHQKEKDFTNVSQEEYDLPKEKVYYLIEFDDNTKEKFESSKGVFLIEDREQLKATIGDIYVGATIRFYQNNNQDDFQKILRIFDTNNEIEIFDRYSNSWKESLRKLKEKDNIDILYSKLCKNGTILGLNTFRQYFDDSTTRFPRRRTLSAIKDLCIEYGLSQELITVDFENFISHSKKDHLIRQQAGRIIGSDLIDFVASNGKEISDSLRKIPIETLDRLIKTIHEKKVKQKILLEND